MALAVALRLFFSACASSQITRRQDTRCSTDTGPSADTAADDDEEGAAAAADADAAPSGADDAAARFSAELSRRRIASIDDIKDRPAPPPGFARDAELSSGQLERSQRLNAEGLEGLIPRGTELLKLGLSFFLAFGPFILGVALATAIVWSVFGEAFIHVSSAAPLVGQSRQKTSRKPTNLRTTH